MQFFAVIHSSHSFLVSDDGHAGPSIPLIGVDPPFDASGVLTDSCVEAFDTVVGRTEAFAEQFTHTQPLQGQGLFQALFEGVGRRTLHFLQIRMQVAQFLPGQLVVGFFICLIQSPFDLLLLAFGQVAQHVFPLMPLAALDHGCCTEKFFEGLFDPLWLRQSRTAGLLRS